MEVLGKEGTVGRGGIGIGIGIDGKEGTFDGENEN